MCYTYIVKIEEEVKMKRQKGFTLIELLAVIVILAIIALIATPMIMDVIDKAKKGAAEASMNGYVDSIEKYSIIGSGDELITNGIPEGIYEFTDGESSANKGVTLDSVPSKGEKPVEGWVAVNSKGYVEAADLKFNSYGNSIVYVTGSVGKASKTAAPSTTPVKGENETRSLMQIAKETAETALGKTTPAA